METLIESIRITTSLAAVVTAVVALRALRDASAAPSRLLGVAPAWLALATAGATILSHGLPTLPFAGLLPLGAGVGVALGFAALFSPGIDARFRALEDGQWRLLMALRAVFGALLLAGGATGLVPISFALTAGLGDLAVGGLAIAAPGSLAAGGARGARLLVFGFGLADFIGVITMIFRVVVPWLAQTHSPGISLLLPWIAVPVLLTVNLFGLRQVLRELAPRSQTA